MAQPKTTNKKITFTLNAPDAENVALAGTFNNWNTSSHPMKRARKGKNGQGDWQIKISLEPGTYQYLFVVDGQWWNDPGANEQMPNEFGTLNDVMHL
ncbi:isoamylase early set domain-containing protein [Syntrophorhabdus aromaticivorans]|uniref:isoamylase early set domain-containing protein n=1 Tax=Syntrophorhabdus aromaticivorans TaxID=328301 RepID=UPI00041C17E8|nr:isoamylase early set domain-containing protein [Syntrophorhabdus aromaticivorans]